MAEKAVLVRNYAGHAPPEVLDFTNRLRGHAHGEIRGSSPASKQMRHARSSESPIAEFTGAHCLIQVAVGRRQDPCIHPDITLAAQS